MAPFRQTKIERLGYFDGQLLTARDLQDDVAYEARMRGLHVRAMHNTWGIALGYELSVTAENLILIGPGIAYDCHGREIISVRTLNVGLPPLPREDADAWWFDLVIRYNEAVNGRAADGGCLAEGLNPQEERPSWRWVLAGRAPDPADPPVEVADDVRLGEELPLARFRITANRQVSQPDFATRRQAQGLVRPHIASEQVNGLFTFDSQQAALTATIDTANGGFNQTPFYFASLVPPPVIDMSKVSAETLAAVHRILGPFLSIRNPARTSFTLDMRFASSRRDINLEEGAHISIPVNWIGIEPIGGCPPPPSLVWFLLFLSPFNQSLAAQFSSNSFLGRF